MASGSARACVRLVEYRQDVVEQRGLAGSQEPSEHSDWNLRGLAHLAFCGALLSSCRRASTLSARLGALGIMMTKTRTPEYLISNVRSTCRDLSVESIN